MFGNEIKQSWDNRTAVILLTEIKVWDLIQSRVSVSSHQSQPWVPLYFGANFMVFLILFTKDVVSYEG